MENILLRMADDFFGRLDGPLHFRFIFQPLMACILAVIDGIKDSKSDKPLYFWTLISHPANYKEMLKNSWKRIGKIFIIALILDIVYQLKFQHCLYPGEMLIVAFFLAFVPYVIFRGPINCLLFLFKKKN